MNQQELGLKVMRGLVKRPRLVDALFRLDKWGNIMGPDRWSNPYPIYERMDRDLRRLHHRRVTASLERITCVSQPHDPGGETRLTRDHPITHLTSPGWSGPKSIHGAINRSCVTLNAKQITVVRAG